MYKLTVFVQITAISDWGHIFAKPKILSRKNNEPTLLILSRAMTVITSISGRPNVSLAYVWKSINKQSSFAKKKIQFFRSTHA